MIESKRIQVENIVTSDVNKDLFWVIVADSSAAIVYTRDSRRGALRQSDSLQNPFARKKTAELIADKGGRSFDSHGEGRHTLTKEKSSPKKHQAAAFAKEIAERIVSAKRSGECREFVLIAAPQFLGLLRDALLISPDVVPEASYDKSVVGESVDVIESILRSG